MSSGLGDADVEDAVGVGRGDEEAALQILIGFVGSPVSHAFGTSRLPEHIDGVRAEPDGPERRVVGGLELRNRAIGPTRDEEGLELLGKENAIGTAAGLDFADQHAGLRIDDDQAVVIEVGRVDQVAVLGERDIADEVLIGAFGFFDDGELPRGHERALGVSEFVDGGSGAAADIDEVAFRREGEAQPGVGNGNARGLFHVAECR